MKQCLLLFLCAGRLHGQYMAGGKIVTQRDFTDSPEEHDNFVTFLQTARHPTYLLVDLIEEDFRHETVPHLHGSRRTALLQRKVEQYYRNTPFHQATLLQRQPSGRRDDAMLFSALTNPALLTPWLDIMLSQKIPLVGIYSIPQISAALAGHRPANHLLLISWERLVGLRQSYFNEQRLQFSRLTPVHADLTFPAAVANELAHTYQYLKSLSLLPSGHTLEVRILCHADDRAALDAGALPDETDLRYNFADLNETARQLKIDYAFTDSDASQLFLHQLATKPPKANYAGAAHRHYHKLWQLRRMLYLNGSALLLGSLAWAAVNVWQGNANTKEAMVLNTRTHPILDELQVIARTFPSAPAPASDVKAAVTVMHQFAQASAAPTDILRPLSVTLDRYPQIELDELSWRTNGAKPDSARSNNEVSRLIIALKGHLAGYANDYRAALNCLERFQRDLAAQGYQVIVLEQPLDLRPGGSIADPGEARTDAFGFSLKLLRNLITEGNAA